MTNYNNPKGSKDSTDRVDPNRDEEIQYQRERAAENSGAVNGIALGGTIAALMGLSAAAIYYFSRPNPTPTTIINTPTPVNSSNPKPAQPTKIIERTIEKTAPSAPSTQIIEVPKPILVPGATKTIEVPKPILVPGATKIIEVPKPIPVPPTPSTAKEPAPPKASSSPSSTPAPTLNPDPAPTSESPAPKAPSGNN